MKPPPHKETPWRWISLAVAAGLFYVVVLLAGVVYATLTAFPEFKRPAVVDRALQSSPVRFVMGNINQQVMQKLPLLSVEGLTAWRNFGRGFMEGVTGRPYAPPGRRKAVEAALTPAPTTGAPVNTLALMPGGDDPNPWRPIPAPESASVVVPETAFAVLTQAVGGPADENLARHNARVYAAAWQLALANADSFPTDGQPLYVLAVAEESGALKPVLAAKFDLANPQAQLQKLRAGPYVLTASLSPRLENAPELPREIHLQTVRDGSTRTFLYRNRIAGGPSAGTEPDPGTLMWTQGGLSFHGDAPGARLHLFTLRPPLLPEPPADAQKFPSSAPGAFSVRPSANTH